MLNITFETEGDKWKWGGIIGGIGMTLMATGVVLGCLCKNCLKKKREEMKLREKYKDKAKTTELCVDDESSRLKYKMSSGSSYEIEEV